MDPTKVAMELIRQESAETIAKVWQDASRNNSLIGGVLSMQFRIPRMNAEAAVRAAIKRLKRLGQLPVEQKT